MQSSRVRRGVAAGLVVLAPFGLTACSGEKDPTPKNSAGDLQIQAAQIGRRALAHRDRAVILKDSHWPNAIIYQFRGTTHPDTETVRTSTVRVLMSEHHGQPINPSSTFHIEAEERSCNNFGAKECTENVGTMSKVRDNQWKATFLGRTILAGNEVGLTVLDRDINATLTAALAGAHVGQ